jgi:trehalose-6-phosphate synthase
VDGCRIVNPANWDQGRLDNWWNAYKQVNAEFMNVLTGLVRSGDILWIHDYHCR